MKTTTKLLVLLAFLALLAGCGGGGASCGSFGASCSSSSGSSGSSSSSTGSSSSSSSSSTSSGGGVTVELGSGTGTSFKSGVLAIAAPSLSAGGTTTVTAILENSNGTAYTQSATITFNSPCNGAGTATFNPASVTTTTGTATTTYTAKGCSGQDTITASSTVGTANLTATGTVNIAAANVGSIQFISATPTQVSLAGTGGTQTSTVIFEVTDVTGAPVSNANVTFSLDTTVGGIVLTPNSAVSGTNGQVQTILQSGTQHGSVRVIATTTTPSSTQIQTESTGIVISTGIPTENNFSLSIVDPNLEGLSFDGLTTQVNVIASDRFNNPVPDGTTISFTTNGGQIAPSCTTTGGSCSVTWTSADPRPVNGPNSVAGHAEILAYATGEESFTDTNGNGIFDGSDLFSLYGGGPGDAFDPPGQDDIGEVYLDGNESGAYVSGDFFFDFNNDGVRNPPDHHYHGANCKGTTTVACASTPTLGIGKQDCIVMSGSALQFVGLPAHIASPGSATVTLTDKNGNPPPSGTTIASVSGSSVTPTIIGSPVGLVNCNGTVQFIVNVPASVTGTFQIQATTPKNVVTVSSTVTVP